MELDSEGIKTLISGSILLLLIVVAPYLWFIDLMTKQRTFGILLAAELVAFSMLIYASTRQSSNPLGRRWILAGCIALALLLSLAVAVQ